MEVLFEHCSCLGKWHRVPAGVSYSKDTYHRYVDTELDDSGLGRCPSGSREFRLYHGSIGGLQDLDESLMI